MRFQPALADVRIIEFPATPVAVLEHRGDPARLGDSLRAFIAWRRLAGLSPPASATFNVLYNDPWSTPPADFRLGLCAGLAHLPTLAPGALPGPAAAVPAGLRRDTLPGGRCAVLRQPGSPDDLRGGLEFLFHSWLPQSGEALRDAPALAQRVRFFPDVPESEALTDLFLPLAGGGAAR